MKRRYLPWLFLLLVFLPGCDQQPEQQRKIKLATPAPAAGSGQRFTSTIHLEPGSRRAIAILFFENQTGDPGLEWLQKGVTEMLIRALSQTSSLSVLSTDRIFEIMQQAGQKSALPALDFELAAIVSQEANVEAVLTGAITRKGDSLQIRVKVHEPSQGKIVQEQSVEGKNLDALFIMVDQLSQKVKNTLTLTLEQQEMAQGIADLSTNSIEAWRYYAAGVDLEQKALLAEAIVQYEQAVAADPAFVAARIKLCLFLLSRGERQRGYAHFEKLKSLRHKATAKEQYQIDRLESSIHGDLGQAIAISKRWLDNNPNDIDACFNLGDLYFGLQNYAEALRYYQQILTLDPKYKIAYNQIGYCCARTGDLEGAVAALDQYKALAPNEPNPFDSMGEIYYNYGKFERAEKNLRQALKNNADFTNSWLTLANLYLDQGEFAKAEETIRQLLDRASDAVTRSNGHSLLGLINWRMGNMEEAVTSLQKMVEDRLFSYRAATWQYELYLEKRDTLGAREALERNYHFIRDSLVMREPTAALQLARLALWYDICPEETIKSMEEALARSSSPGMEIWGRFYLAMLYLKAGRLDEYQQRTPDFVRNLTEYLTDVRDVSFARETWKSLLFFNRYACRTTQEGTVKYQRLIEYCAADKLIRPEMLFRLYLAELYTCQQELEKARAELRIAGAPEEEKWLISAPYDNTNGFLRRYPPEREKRTGKTVSGAKGQIAWRHPQDGNQEGYINLMTLYQEHNWVVGYGLIYLQSPDRRPAQLRVGTNDAARMWFNDAEVWRMNMGRDAVFDNDIIEVMLQPGLNKVLIKVCNQINEWGYYFRLTDAQGRGMPDIHFVSADEIHQESGYDHGD